MNTETRKAFEDIGKQLAELKAKHPDGRIGACIACATTFIQKGIEHCDNPNAVTPLAGAAPLRLRD